METAGRFLKPYGWVIEWDDGVEKTQFFTDHYNKVRNARKEDHEKYIFNSENHGLIENHELVGKKIINFHEKECFVESVHKHWYMGFYIIILYYTLTDRGKRSHGTMFYQNINCQYPLFCEYFEENKNVKFE